MEGVLVMLERLGVGRSVMLEGVLVIFEGKRVLLFEFVGFKFPDIF